MTDKNFTEVSPEPSQPQGFCSFNHEHRIRLHERQGWCHIDWKAAPPSSPSPRREDACPFCSNWHDSNEDCDHPRYDKSNISRKVKEAWRQGYEAGKNRWSQAPTTPVPHPIPCGTATISSSPSPQPAERYEYKLPEIGSTSMNTSNPMEFIDELGNPDKCPNCNGHHLGGCHKKDEPSPKCGNKRIYESRYEADARILTLPTMPKLYVYMCKECRGFHLTKHDPVQWGRLNRNDDPEEWEGLNKVEDEPSQSYTPTGLDHPEHAQYRERLEEIVKRYSLHVCKPSCHNPCMIMEDLESAKTKLDEPSREAFMSAEEFYITAWRNNPLMGWFNLKTLCQFAEAYLSAFKEWQSKKA